MLFCVVIGKKDCEQRQLSSYLQWERTLRFFLRILLRHWRSLINIRWCITSRSRGQWSRGTMLHGTVTTGCWWGRRFYLTLQPAQHHRASCYVLTFTIPLPPSPKHIHMCICKCMFVERERQVIYHNFFSIICNEIE